MSKLARSLVVAWLSAIPCFAQTVDIFSEFHRVDPFGNVVPADRGLTTREILSPAVVRNGFASFHIAITLPVGEDYLLYVVTNPINACRVALYKEHFVKTAAGWVPDTLTELHRLPDFGVVPDPDDGIPGQTTRLYLLDLWIPPNADVARFRLEVQLKVGTWTVRPMEIRVMPGRVPEIRSGTPALTASVEAGADATAAAALYAFLAGKQPAPPRELRTVRDIIQRNAAQDMALVTESRLPDLMHRTVELFDANARLAPRPMGAEWYLRIRDLLYAPR